MDWIRSSPPWLWVGTGGALGTLIRASFDFLAAQTPLGIGAGILPWSTVLVNLVGAFLLGTIASFFALLPVTESGIRLGLFAGTGVCGALTTYSTLILSTLLAVQGNEGVAAGAVISAGAQSLGLLVAGVIAAWGGWNTVTAIARWRGVGVKE